MNAKRSNIVVSGVNHRVADVEFREQLALDKEGSGRVLQAMVSEPGIDEAVVVNTCNRIEVVAAGRGAVVPVVQSAVESVLAGVSGVSRHVLGKNLYCFENSQAVSHVFRVSSGLDSMVVGEPQILGQLKNAYRLAVSEGTISVLLNRLFSRAFGVAKLVRTRTKIGEKAVSVCYAAKELAQQIFGDLEEASVMLIGAGEMGALSLKHFQTSGARQFFVVNKSVERAVALAAEYDAVPLSLNNFSEFLSQADIIIGASTLPVGASPLVAEEAVRRALHGRPGKAQFYIDLAVPRNFAASIEGVEDAFLYNIDDLEGIVKENLDARTLEVEEARRIADLEALKFGRWLETRQIEPLVKETFARCARIKEDEVRKTLKRLRREGVRESDLLQIEDAIDSLTEAVIHKTLHRPVTVLKERAIENESFAAMFEEFFGDREGREGGE